MNINFYKIDEAQLLSYNYFINQISNNDLQEINSFKIRNILSITFNTRIKDLILENIFNDKGSFLSNETKDNLFRYLSLVERKEIKDYLSNYLDFQIASKWYNSIIQVLNKESINTILIPTLILNHDLILAQLKSLFPQKIFVDWFNYDETKKVLILDYNHAWKKRNIFIIRESNSKAYFLKHFFKNTYKWKQYNEERHLFNRMNTKTREVLFGKELLGELKERLASIRPKTTLNKWDLLHENEHKNSFNPQEEIVIYYSKTNSNRYRISSLYLLAKEGKYTIKDAKELVSKPEMFEEKFKFSNIENIISQLDLSKLNKAIEKDQSLNQIIQPLWNKFNLNENDGRLWKQLLHRKVKENGTKAVYSKIEEISGVRNFISLNTFENSYCNPENNTIIPREKKVFKAICQYLELPLEYRAAIHRERNLIGGHSQELHSKLKEIIKAIVEFGVLDKYKFDDDLLNILNHTVEIIEKRVDMDYFGFTRESLIYASIEICYEIIDKMRLKPILKIEHITSN